MSMTSLPSPLRNAVLDDPHLQAQLAAVNQAFGEFCTRVAGEAWGLPLIDQPTKALIAIAIDVVSQGLTAESPFETHIQMAIKQGISFEQIEEVLMFCCVYAGFNKAAPAFVQLTEIRQRIEAEA